MMKKRNKWEENPILEAVNELARQELIIRGVFTIIGAVFIVWLLWVLN